MYKGSLFERLTGGINRVYGLTEEEVIYQSVANNLSRIFSTNAGSAQIALDYGRPDLNNIEMSMKDSVESIEASSERCIEKYEPRLYRAKVAVSRERLSVNQMSIYIEAFLLVGGKRQKIYYKADLLSNGKVKVYQDGN